VSQDVITLGVPISKEKGYGKGGNLKSAFHFPTTPAAATSIDFADVA
jgi:hypothetical protein